MSKKKLLIISGPTATGKTSLAVKISRHLPSVLISADSRQVYQGMDIGTGKDHPPSIKIHLIDILNPSQSFSAAQFYLKALKIIKQAHSARLLPIVVGGTGLYLDCLINPRRSTFLLKPNPLLRFLLNKLPLFVLQKIFKLLDSSSFKSLNSSDVRNPRRLIRQIETKLLSPLFLQTSFSSPKFNLFHLSLTASNQFIYSRIDARVGERLKLGLIGEIRKLLQTYSWSAPGLNTLAYKEFKPYFQAKSPLSACIRQWRFDEHALARRQKTWFKKYKNSQFFNINSPRFPQNALKSVLKWYNQP